MAAWIGFTAAAIVLLGSPGPGIAALVVAGRRRGAVGALAFFGAMQAGLWIAVGVSLLGLSALLATQPGLRLALTVVSTAYLLWLAWATATAPVGGGHQAADASLSVASGFILGAANPKAYLALAGLFGSFVLMEPAQGEGDMVAKGAIAVMVMAVVDYGWVLVGAALGRLTLAASGERTMNIAMGGAIVLALAVPFI